jgi:tetratricopeptide (TPR) repeat protein
LDEQLVREAPTNLLYREGLAYSLLDLGGLFYRAGRMSSAEKTFRRGLDLMQSEAADYTARRYLLAVMYIRFGEVMCDNCRFAAAEEALRRGTDLAEKLANSAGDGRSGVQNQVELAHGLRLLGNALGKNHLDRPQEALVVCQRSVKILERLVATFPAVPTYRLELFESLRGLRNYLGDHGRFDEAESYRLRAVELAEKLTLEYPGEPIYRERLVLIADDMGIQLANAGRLAEAEAAIRKNLAAHERLAADYPAVFTYRRNLARMLCHLSEALKTLGRLPEAEAECRRAVNLAPDDAFTYSSLAKFLALQGKHGEAEAAARRALYLNPDDDTARFQIGKALFDQGSFAEAEPFLRRSSEGANPNRVYAILVLGLTLAGLGRNVEAEESYRKVISLNPGDSAAYENLGIVLARQGRLPEADVAYRKAISLKPDGDSAYVHLGKLLGRQGRLPEAEVAYRKAILLKPDGDLAYVRLGTILAQLGQLPEAEAAHRRAVELKPDSTLNLCNLADALVQQARFSEAEVAYRRAIGLEPGCVLAHADFGAMLVTSGRWEEAAASLHRAIELKPDYALAHYNLGTVLLRQGQYSEALAERRLGHEMGSKQPDWDHPSEAWAREVEQWIVLEEKLPAVLSGAAKAADAGESLVLAQMCQDHKKLFAAAARFFTEAFAAEPKLAKDLDSHRYNAACAAALAGCGLGNDADKLDDAGRFRLRQQALDWLTAEFAAWNKVADKPAAHPKVRQIMQHWQKDTDFADVRGADALAKLPAAERVAWQKMWADVAELLKRCEKPPAAEKPPPKP